MARVANCIRALAARFMYLHKPSLELAYDASLAHPVGDLLSEPVLDAVASSVRSQLAEAEAAMLE